jgi:hypothetical protein
MKIWRRGNSRKATQAAGLVTDNAAAARRDPPRVFRVFLRGCASTLISASTSETMIPGLVVLGRK